ncbi:MAG: DUF2141 domain-containing protein [Flavobacteriales bacterium]|nr:DUF2141 domain-containing protein [Flavobacteriales bacterium]
MRYQIALAFVLFAYATSAQSVLDVEVVLSDPDAEGTLRLALCPNESAFDADKGSTLHTVKAGGGPVRFRIADLVPGVYAIKIFHDVNNNGELDTNWLGIPTEPYGFSNDAMGTFGPPAFKDASFVVGEGRSTIRIKMRG